MEKEMPIKKPWYAPQTTEIAVKKTDFWLNNDSYTETADYGMDNELMGVLIGDFTLIYRIS